MKTTSGKMKMSEKIICAKNMYIDHQAPGMCSYFDDGKPILFNYFIAVLFFGARLGYKDFFGGNLVTENQDLNISIG